MSSGCGRSGEIRVGVRSSNGWFAMGFSCTFEPTDGTILYKFRKFLAFKFLIKILYLAQISARYPADQGDIH